ncbi:hypothetical protein [Actinomadura miaoliensis]|uniref:hypothetical protein n=1 Tax=Actinomadura miaoliensis TaxID=430685 RepID=UPI0031E78046
MAGEVGVEPVGDFVVAQALQRPQLEDRRYGGPLGRIRDQARFGLAFRAFGRHGVRTFFGHVAIGWTANVPALFGVLAEAVPGQFEHLHDVPFGDGLVDPPRENWSCSLAGAASVPDVGQDGFVGGQQRHAVLFQLMLDLGAVVGAARDTSDFFADHRYESPVRSCGLDQQVLDSAVAGDRDVELLVRTAVAAFIEFFAARLDVVEVRDNHVPAGQGLAGLA